ncbi:MAG: hypothetical protein KO464_01530 [Candidatus Methanofastidiosum sp.]|nr:hypothetical protein [Methanofastidiosum sp.]
MTKIKTEESFYIIEDFSKTNFHELFINLYSIQNNIKNSLQISFLKGYLSHLECKSILIESKYIDRDYLMDYQDFYVRCSRPYDKKCKRAHFFSCDVKQEDIIKIIESPLQQTKKIEELQKKYLGFSVIKPLPDKVIGKTCIKHYPAEEIRHFLSIKEYSSNLFGINFKVNTLAFQQQDTIMAACATVSLWCAFQQTSELFGHYVHSPGQITKSATTNIIDKQRIIPSQGLTPGQICDAVRHVGLAYETFSVMDKESFLGIIYSYLKMNLPIIMGFLRPDNKYHAVTITGYKLEKLKEKEENKVQENEEKEGIKNIKMISNNISELYIHDDQIGPFSRVYIREKSADDIPKVLIKFPKDKNQEDILKDVRLVPLYLFSEKYVSSKPGLKLELVYPETGNLEIDAKNSANKLVTPDILIIPLYEKIRINFSSIYKEVNRINTFLRTMIKSEIIWDIFLYTSNKFKEELIQNEILSKEYKIKLLSECMPKYIWRCQAKIQNKIFLEIIFDSTDIGANTALLYLISGDDQKKFLKDEFNKKEKEKNYIDNIIEIVDIEFINNFKNYITQ